MVYQKTYHWITFNKYFPEMYFPKIHSFTLDIRGQYFLEFCIKRTVSQKANKKTPPPHTHTYTHTQGKLSISIDSIKEKKSKT